MSRPRIFAFGLLNRFYIDTPGLHERGWTETMIRRLLGEAEEWGPVDYWANFTGKRYFCLDRVEMVESTDLFRQAFTKSAKRRHLSVERTEEVLAASLRLEKEDAPGRYKQNLLDEKAEGKRRACEEARKARAKKKRLAERDRRYRRREGIDPFGKQELSPPGATRPYNAVHVASFDVNYIVDVIEEDYYIYTLPDDRYELWRWRMDKQEVIARLAMDECTQREAAKHLLEQVCLVSAEFTGLGDLSRPGLVDEEAWQSILAAIQRHTAEEGHPDPHGLLKVAGELGLMPGPVPGRKPQYQANCPGRNHWLYINADGGAWFCGYCRRKGGAAELRSYTAERRE